MRATRWLASFNPSRLTLRSALLLCALPLTACVPLSPPMPAVTVKDCPKPAAPPPALMVAPPSSGTFSNALMTLQQQEQKTLNPSPAK